jgi:hypothetical protein
MREKATARMVAGLQILSSEFWGSHGTAKSERNVPLSATRHLSILVEIFETYL